MSEPKHVGAVALVMHAARDLGAMGPASFCDIAEHVDRGGRRLVAGNTFRSGPGHELGEHWPAVLPRTSVRAQLGPSPDRKSLGKAGQIPDRIDRDLRQPRRCHWACTETLAVGTQTAWPQAPSRISGKVEPRPRHPRCSGGYRRHSRRCPLPKFLGDQNDPRGRGATIFAGSRHLLKNGPDGCRRKGVGEIRGAGSDRAHPAETGRGARYIA